MQISNLTLRSFRSYKHEKIEFSPGLNVIVGENGAGKTNIVEAIHFLSLARSFRTNESSELIMKSCQFGAIEARVEQLTTSKIIEVFMTPSGNKIKVNGNQIKRISDLRSVVNVIVFQPKDSLFFNSSQPSVRRTFIDTSLSKQSPIYLENLMMYEKLLRERNSILKNPSLDRVQLDVVTKQLVDVSETIVKMRTEFIAAVNKYLSKIIYQIKGENDKAHIIYEPYVTYGNNFKELALRAYERALDSDIKRGATQIGIQREDIKLILNGQDISTCGSQGENRIAVISLKLAPYFLISEEGAKPIIVLDDVMSELDRKHQERLITFLRKFEQVFITSTTTNVKNASIYEVKEHKVTRRNA